jgi:hypothetical protein
MIKIKTAKQGVTYSAGDLPDTITNDAMIWVRVGVNEDYNVTLRPDGSIGVEYVFWVEEDGDWDSEIIKNEDVTEDITIFRPY